MTNSAAGTVLGYLQSLRRRVRRPERDSPWRTVVLTGSSLLLVLSVGLLAAPGVSQHSSMPRVLAAVLPHEHFLPDRLARRCQFSSHADGSAKSPCSVAISADLSTHQFAHPGILGGVNRSLATQYCQQALYGKSRDGCWPSINHRLTGQGCQQVQTIMAGQDLLWHAAPLTGPRGGSWTCLVVHAERVHIRSVRSNHHTPRASPISAGLAAWLQNHPRYDNRTLLSFLIFRMHGHLHIQYPRHLTTRSNFVRRFVQTLNLVPAPAWVLVDCASEGQEHGQTPPIRSFLGQASIRGPPTCTPHLLSGVLYVHQQPARASWL